MSNGADKWTYVIESSIELLVAGIDQRLDFKQLADTAGFSPYHFHKVFRAIAGESPAGLSRRIKLERAAYEIANTERPVGEIAMDAGFEAVEAFTRSFQKRFEVNPSVYRKNLQEVFWLECPNGVHFQPAGAPLGFVPVSYRAINMELRTDSSPQGDFIKKRVHGAYTDLGQKWGAFFQELYKSGSIRGPVSTATVFFDDPDAVPVEELRADMCVTRTGDVAAPEGTELGELSQGRFAVATYTGHYDGLADAWAKVYGEMLSDAGHTPREGNCFEMYLDDPTKTPPEKLRTEIWVPID